MQMNQLVTNAQLVQVLGISRQSIEKQSGAWRVQMHRGRGGKVKHYEVASLPTEIQRKLITHRLQNLSINDLEPRRCHTESAVNLHKAPEPVLERALTRAKVVELAEQAMQQGKTKGLNRGEALDRWLNEFNRGLVNRELKEQTGFLSGRKVYRWRKAFNEEGLNGLMDKRGKYQRTTIDQEVRDFIEICVLSRPGIPSAEIFKLMAFKFKDRKLPAKGTVKNLVSHIRKEKAALITHLHHPSVFKRHHQPSLGRADAELTEPNQCWEADSTRVDLMTADGKRCTMIVVVDVWSRRPVFGVWEKGGGDPIAATFFKAFKKLGVPRQVIVDLGKDYQSKQVQSLFFDLGIDAPEIPGYSPELKPHAEIAFHLVSGLLRSLTGYTGNKLANRPEVIETKHTLAELQDYVDKWVVDHENNHTVSTIGSTPRERWDSAEAQGWQPDVASLEQLFLLLKPPVERTTTRCKIHFNNGLYTAKELFDLDPAERVLVRPDPEDAGIVYVFDREGEFICIATDLDRLGLTPQQITAQKKQWWATRRAEVRAVREREKAAEIDDVQRARLDAVVSEAKPYPPLPAPNIELPAIGAAAEARRDFFGQKPPDSPSLGDQGMGQAIPWEIGEAKSHGVDVAGGHRANGQMVLSPWGEQIDISTRPLFTSESSLPRAIWIMARVREGLPNAPRGSRLPE